MSAHNICFHAEIRIISKCFVTRNSSLSRSMLYNIFVGTTTNNPHQVKAYLLTDANNDGTDKPVRLCSLINFFIVNLQNQQILQ